jgi:hypothetical protein
MVSVFFSSGVIAIHVPGAILNMTTAAEVMCICAIMVSAAI